MHVMPALAVLLALAGCQAPEPGVPPRSYLLSRNAVDLKKPCLIARFATVPVEVAHDRVYASVLVNGISTFGIVDTGGEVSLLTPEIVARAKLLAVPQRHQRVMQGVTGDFDVRSAQANTLQIGGQKYIHPDTFFVANFAGSNMEAVGALIGSNLVGGIDWDLDFAHGKMTSYETRNCQDVDPVWDTKSTGIPMTRTAQDLSFADYGLFGAPFLVTIPVTFDGGTVWALLDTGAPRSYLTLEGAHKAGITNSDLEHDPVDEISGLNARKTEVYLHKAANLVVGEDLIHDFTVSVAETRNRNNSFDMILGMDWIGKHHLWLSYTTDSLYIDSGEKKPPGWRAAPTLPAS